LPPLSRILSSWISSFYLSIRCSSSKVFTMSVS
jgi:hypothetical protein